MSFARSVWWCCVCFCVCFLRRFVLSHHMCEAFRRPSVGRWPWLRCRCVGCCCCCRWLWRLAPRCLEEGVGQWLGEKLYSVCASSRCVLRAVAIDCVSCGGSVGPAAARAHTSSWFSVVGATPYFLAAVSMGGAARAAGWPSYTSKKTIFVDSVECTSPHVLDRA